MIRTFDITPEQLLGRTAAKEEMTEERRWKTPYPRKILEGDKGPRRDVVWVNAGAALVVPGWPPISGGHQDGEERSTRAGDAKLDELVVY